MKSRSLSGNFNRACFFLKNKLAQKKHLPENEAEGWLALRA